MRHNLDVFQEEVVANWVCYVLALACVAMRESVGPYVVGLDGLAIKECNDGFDGESRKW